MPDASPPIEVNMRIPGVWAGPKDLLETLPRGCRLTQEGLLVLSDGSKIEFGAVPADEEFPNVFRTSCRNKPTDAELAIVRDYKVNVLLSGPGGSMDAARTMMRAAAAIIEAGGAGVFIDNGLISHGASQWLEMTEDGGPDAVSFAFVSLTRRKGDVFTMGMHVMGLHDIVMKEADIKRLGIDIVDMIRYLAAGDKPMGDGHIIADLDGARFRCQLETNETHPKGSVMENPYGCLRLVSIKDIAEAN